MRFARPATRSRLLRHLSAFPAAGLVGARQVGKTTLAKDLVASAETPAEYLDLQQPSARARLFDAEAYLRSKATSLVVLDEVQSMPEVFPILRAAIDEDRRPGRFLLLGSAAPELLRSTAESLAGRIAYTELTGLRLDELPADSSVDEHWLRGGFPFAYQLEDFESRIDFFSAYLQTFVGTDLRDLAGGSDPAGMRRLVVMLAHLQGSTLNYSQLGRSLEVSYKTIKRYLDILESAFLTRVLPPHLPNLRKRLTKAPKIYLRDSGLVHGLLDIASTDALLAHPVVGGSWEGYAVEQVLAAVPPRTEAYHYRSARGHEVDLVLVSPAGRIHAVEIKRSNAPTISANLREAFEDIDPERASVVTPGAKRYPIGEKAEVVGLQNLLADLSARQA